MAAATKKSTGATAPAIETVTIKPPNLKTLQVEIEGTAPLVICRFSQKSIEAIRTAQEAGSVSKSKRNREPKNFQQLFEDAKHVSVEGWEGIHAAAFRCGAISACRLAGFVMARAKLAFNVVPDSFDRVDGMPLVRLTRGVAEQYVAPTRNRSGVVDLRSRPMYREWGAVVTISYDGDTFTANDVANLMARVGMQVGVGEGRPDSRDSAGVGFGLFRLV